MIKKTNSNKNQLYKKRARWDPDQGKLLFHTCLRKVLFPFALRWIFTKVVRKKMWVNILSVVVIFMWFFFQFSCVTARVQQGKDYYLVIMCLYVYSCEKENKLFCDLSYIASTAMSVQHYLAEFSTRLECIIF